VLSVFDWVAAQQRSDWARGCPFVNASVELVASDDAEAREMIQRHGFVAAWPISRLRLGL